MLIMHEFYHQFLLSRILEGILVPMGYISQYLVDIVIDSQQVFRISYACSSCITKAKQPLLSPSLLMCLFPYPCICVCINTQTYIQSNHFTTVQKFRKKKETKLSFSPGFSGTGDAGLGRSLGEGNRNPLQYSYLCNPIDIGALQATVYGVAKISDMTQLLNNNKFLTTGIPMTSF